MARVGKTDGNPLRDIDVAIVPAGNKTGKDADGVVHLIKRHIFFAPRAFSFAVAPFRLEHLDMRAVAQHDTA